MMRAAPGRDRVNSFSRSCRADPPLRARSASPAYDVSVGIHTCRIDTRANGHSGVDVPRVSSTAPQTTLAQHLDDVDRITAGQATHLGRAIAALEYDHRRILIVVRHAAADPLVAAAFEPSARASCSAFIAISLRETAKRKHRRLVGGGVKAYILLVAQNHTHYQDPQCFRLRVSY